MTKGRNAFSCEDIYCIIISITDHQCKLDNSFHGPGKST